MSNLLILSAHAAEYRTLVEAARLPSLVIVCASKTPDASVAGKQIEIVFGEPSLIREVLPALTGLRWVQATWAGVEPLLDPRLRRDYLLTNARGVFGRLMSEYVFGYLLAHERRIFDHQLAQREHRWDSAAIGTLRGKTIGLLGVGSIGAHLAGTARHFCMSVRGFTRASESCRDVDRYFHSHGLLEFARGLDYLVNTLPNTPQTHQIVDAALLQAMPSHALFLNVGRSNAVDESALLAALAGGNIAGAVLDVFEQEPLPPQHPFWSTPNLRVTFHTAAPSYPEDLTSLFARNYRRYLVGEDLLFQVDFERGY